jgi:hypothetical protein
MIPKKALVTATKRSKRNTLKIASQGLTFLVPGS